MAKKLQDITDSRTVSVAAKPALELVDSTAVKPVNEHAVRDMVFMGLFLVCACGFFAFV